MTIASEITRLQGAKSNIKTAIEAKGVTVGSSVKLDGYSTLISSIEQGVSQAEYDALEQRYEDLQEVSGSLLSGVTLGSINLGSARSTYPLGGGSAPLYKIGNYLFAMGPIGTRDISGSNYKFYGYFATVYKQLSGTSWTTRHGGSTYQSNSTSNGASINFDARYLGNNVINVTISVVGNFSGGTTTKYFDWTIGSNSLTETSLKSGENMNNYKIFDGSLNMTGSSNQDIIGTFKLN